MPRRLESDGGVTFSPEFRELVILAPSTYHWDGQLYGLPEDISEAIDAWLAGPEAVAVLKARWVAAQEGLG